MPTQTGRGLRPGGVVRAIIRLLVLVVFGFAAGLLFGLVSEEPELLAGHLRGESEAVVLVADAGAEPGDLGDASSSPRTTAAVVMGSLPQVAAAASSKSTSPSVMRATDQPAPSPRRVTSPASDAGGKWAIQVGAFSDEKTALRLTESLRAKGYPAKLLSARGDAGRWRVRVQPMSGESRARETAARLKRDERLPTWVLPMETS